MYKNIYIYIYIEREREIHTHDLEAYKSEKASATKEPAVASDSAFGAARPRAPARTHVDKRYAQFGPVRARRQSRLSCGGGVLMYSTNQMYGLTAFLPNTRNQGETLVFLFRNPEVSPSSRMFGVSATPGCNKNMPPRKNITSSRSSWRP